MPYRVTIDTKAYKPMRCSAKNWEPGTTNDHIRALDGFQSVEQNLTEVGWRLHMFAGMGPRWDAFSTPAYQAWLGQPINRLTYHDRLCDMDRSTEICPPGFKQGYLNIPAMLEALEKEGRIEVPFSKVYDIRQYKHNMDGCVLTVEKVDAPNYQVMAESQKTKDGVYIPDFDALRATASCDEERAYIDRVEEKIKAGKLFKGFRWNMVYITKMACGHYEIFQTPANEHYPVAENLKHAQEHAAQSKCSHCFTNWSLSAAKVAGGKKH